MPAKAEKRAGVSNPNQQLQKRRDLYEVLGVSRGSSDQEIKSSYRKLALKYTVCSVY